MSFIDTRLPAAWTPASVRAARPRFTWKDESSQKHDMRHAGVLPSLGHLRYLVRLRQHARVRQRALLRSSARLVV